MGDIIHVLERRASIPVPQRQRAVVSAREEHAFRVYGEGVDDSVVSAEVEIEHALWALPFLDVVTARRCRGKGVLSRMNRKSAHGLFVMRECDHCLAGSKIP